MTSAPCPVCASVDLARVGDAWTCRSCGTRFEVRGGTPRVLEAGTPPRSGGGTGWGIALVGAAALGALAWWALPRPDAPPPPPARERAADEVTLTPVRRGETPAGEVFWIVTWNNVSSRTFVLPSFSVTLHDGAGVEMARTTGHAVADQIEPGASTYAFASLPTIPAYDDERVVVDGPYTPDAPSRQVRLFVDQTRAEGPPERTVVRARVRAPGPRPVRVTRVVAVGFDATGVAAGWAEGTPPATTVPPGEGVEVQIPVGPYRVSPIEAWTIVAVGYPADDAG